MILNMAQNDSKNGPKTDERLLTFSEEYLRAQLMRSASDEALGVKSDDLEDDVDSIRSPFYKPRTPLRYPLSPQSPPSDESSYQGSIGPGSAPSDRSYNGGRGARGGGGNGVGSIGSGSGGNRYPSAMSGDSRDSRSQEDMEEALQRAGFYMPEYKHWWIRRRLGSTQTRSPLQLKRRLNRFSLKRIDYDYLTKCSHLKQCCCCGGCDSRN